MSTSKPKPLWKAVDQAARLAELTAPLRRTCKRHPLRRDVRSLGAVLGQGLVEQSGNEVFESVEELRRLLIEHREDGTKRTRRRPPRPDLMSRCNNLSRDGLVAAYQVTKAFATYFELTNLAETNHRKRRPAVRESWTARVPPLPGSFRGTLVRMKDAESLRKTQSPLCADRDNSGFYGSSHGGGAADYSTQAPPHCPGIGALRACH